MSDGAGLPTARRPMPGTGGVRAAAPVTPALSADEATPVESAEFAPRPRPRPAGGPPRPELPAGAAEVDAETPDPVYSTHFADRFRRLLAETESTSPDRGAPVQQPDPLWRRALRVAVVLVVVLGAVVALRTFVVGSYYIPSASMEPTLHGCPGCNDDHILVDKLSYRAHAVRAGDIVVFDRPVGDTAPESVLIKRVIGLAGDTVTLRSGSVYVNGAALNEPYVNPACGPHPTQPLQGPSSWRVPQGDVFVLGDNRCDSSDSRVFGPIATSTIVGRAFAIIWPLGRAGTL